MMTQLFLPSRTASAQSLLHLSSPSWRSPFSNLTGTKAHPRKRLVTQRSRRDQYDSFGEISVEGRHLDDWSLRHFTGSSSCNKYFSGTTAYARYLWHDA